MSPAAENVRTHCGAGHNLAKSGTYKPRNGKGVGCVACREKNARARPARDRLSGGGIRIITVLPAPATDVERYPLSEWKTRFADEWERISRAARTAGAYGQIEEAIDA